MSNTSNASGTPGRKPKRKLFRQLVEETKQGLDKTAESIDEEFDGMNREDMIGIPDEDSEEKTYYKQYMVQDGKKYTPIGATRKVIPPGLYQIRMNSVMYAERLKFSHSDLIRFPDSVSEKIVEEFEIFWTKKDAYLERGEPHKRGFLLWGPPGGGKTCVVTTLLQDFIKKDKGVVFLFTTYLSSFLEQFREIEPDRKIMVIMEDIDEWFDNDTEGEILQFLDGEVPLVNTILVATTNYPEKLPDRIINRPSRFDRVTYIENPNEEHRKIYLKKKSSFTKKRLEEIAKDTKGYSFAHLKELILAIELFGANYDETLERLNHMRKADSNSEDYVKDMRGKSGVGFNK